MSLAQAHLDIAKERFLELMADEPGRDVAEAVDLAITQANIFDVKYRKDGYTDTVLPPVGFQNSLAKKMKGCQACFGSGGKVGAPCPVCKGTGKVAK